MTLTTEEIKVELNNIIDEQGADFELSPKTKSIIRAKFQEMYPEVEVPTVASILNAIVKERSMVSGKPDAPPVNSGTTNKTAEQIATNTKPAVRAAKPRTDANGAQIIIAKRSIAQATTGGKARTSSDISCAANTLSDGNITVDGSLFNSVSKTPVSDVKFNDDNSILSSMASLVNLLSPDDADEFWRLHNTYSDATSKLDIKYALAKGKQSFVYSDKTRVIGRKKSDTPEESNPKVTYINPNTGKKAELEAEEAKPIIEYFVFMKKFAKTISDAKISHTQYLSEPVINTQNIFKMDWLTKLIDPVPQNTNKVLNMILIDESSERQKSDTAILNAAPCKYDTDYISLFIDIREFNGSRLPQLVKKVYSHRSGIVGRLPDSVKMDLWKQAYANLRDFDRSNLHSKHENECIDAWLNVLSSRFAYHVVMNCIPGSDLFEKSFNELITEGISIHLFSTSLYPISFAFTPFMLFGDGITLPALNGISSTTYRSNVKNVFTRMQEPVMFDYSKNNWVYYLEHPDKVQNDMVRLLDHAIKDVKTTEPRDEKLHNDADSVIDATTVADSI